MSLIRDLVIADFFWLFKASQLKLGGFVSNQDPSTALSLASTFKEILGDIMKDEFQLKAQCKSGLEYQFLEQKAAKETFN